MFAEDTKQWIVHFFNMKIDEMKWTNQNENNGFSIGLLSKWSKDVSKKGHFLVHGQEGRSKRVTFGALKSSWVAMQPWWEERLCSTRTFCSVWFKFTNVKKTKKCAQKITFNIVKKTERKRLQKMIKNNKKNKKKLFRWKNAFSCFLDVKQ